MADLPLGSETALPAGTTTVLTAPAAATQRIVPRGGWSVYNADTAKRDITFQKDKGGTKTILQKVTQVAVGGVQVLDKVVVLDATNETLEVIVDAITTNNLHCDVAAMETT